MDYTADTLDSANALPSTTDLSDWFARFDNALALLPPEERARRVASMQEILDQAFPAEYPQDDAFLQPSPSLPPLSPLSMSPMTSTAGLAHSPTDTVTPYEALTPYSEATLLASPTVSGSPSEKTFDSDDPQLHIVPETYDQLPERAWDGYDSVQPPSFEDSAARFPDPLLSLLDGLTTAGVRDAWDGEQQLRGIAAAPQDSSHFQGVRVSADTSAITSTSITVPVLGVPVASRFEHVDGRSQPLPNLPQDASYKLPETLWHSDPLRLASRDGAAAPATDPLMADESPLVASGTHDTWDGEQQHGGLAAPYDSSHSQDVRVSAATSAVASISTTIPGAGVPAAKAKQTRKRKTTETPGPEDAGAKPKKPKAAHPCPYEGCSHVATRKNNLQQHVNSKHLRLRPFKCPQKGCKDAFAREHDAARHFQSDHTTLGSPRKVKPPPKNAAMAKN